MSNVTKPIVLNETFEEKLDTTNYFLAAIAQGSGTINVDSPKGLQRLLREGLISKVLTTDHQLSFDQETSMTATVEGTGISAASVVGQTFIEQMGHAGIGWYEFVYTGSAWHFNDSPVALADYGISVTGTAVDGDKIIIHEIGTELIFDVLGIDYDIPSNPQLKHSLSLGMHNCYTNVRFDPEEALYVVNAEDWASGVPAGTTLNVTSDHGTYGGSTTEDGTFQFTTTQPIPVGGRIRHSTMGQWRSSYAKSNVLNGKFITYNASGVQIEQCATTEGSGGTSLGTTSSGDPARKTNAKLNFTSRNAYGSNRWRYSAFRQWVCSALASGWYTPQGEFDFIAQTSPVAGFLYGLDPELLEVVGKCKKRTMLHPADRNGSSYEDLDETWFIPSMTEVGFGANDGVYEAPVENGSAKTVAYPYWQDKGNADRIKYLNGSARNWWLRSAHPNTAYSASQRYVYPSGALNSNYVYITYGAVPHCCII